MTDLLPEKPITAEICGAPQLNAAQHDGGPSPAAKTGRRIAFVILACFILLGPMQRQVFGKSSILLRKWTMFRGYGQAICRIQLLKRDATGSPRPISALQALGYRSWLEVPLHRRRIQSPEEAKALGQTICRRARGSKKDTALLSMIVECGGPDRWIPHSDGTTAMCVEP